MSDFPKDQEMPKIRRLEVPQSGIVEMCSPSVTALLLGAFGGFRVLVRQVFTPEGDEPDDDDEIDEDEEGGGDYRRSALKVA